MLQQGLVVLIVVFAALFAAWRLVGMATRLRAVQALQRLLPVGSAVHRLLERKAQTLRAAMLGGGCGACSKRR
jgi:hypothetical protein